MRKTSAFTASRPVSISKATARSDAPPSSIAAVTHTRPPATTGDDHPEPGTNVFQITFRDSDHSNGKPRAGGVPLARGASELGPVFGLDHNSGHYEQQEYESTGPHRCYSSRSLDH